MAIFPVVLFHAGFLPFAGGFVGVDVFFVISGFLITSLIHPQIVAGEFSFAAFYERRIRRLFPALFAVIAVSLPAGALLLPDDLRSFSLSAVATVLFAANFLFWGSAGYFDGAADSKPLLHAWTLSVEEQFYVLFPAFLLLLLRYAPAHARSLILSLAALSLAGSAAVAARDVAAAFYLPAFRAWELLLGALLAMHALPPIASAALREGLALLGMALIGYAVFTFTEASAFSGTQAFLPCIGTALLIHSGNNGGTRMARLLALPPARFAGLISYSLYLWHWPLLVFAKYFANRELGLAEKFIVIAVSFAAATASWRYVERPFRGRDGLLSRTALFRTAGALTALFAAIGLAGFYSGALPARFQQPAAPAQATGLLYQPCMNLKPSAISAGSLCPLGARGGVAPTFLLWGDSQATTLAPAIDRAAARAGRSGLFAAQAGCAPLLGVERHDRRDLPCGEFNEAVAKLLAENVEIRTVVLAGAWAAYAEGTPFKEPSRPPVLISRDGVGANSREFRDGLERSLRYLADRHRRAVFVAQVPEIGWNVPLVLARSRAYGRPPPPPPSLEDYQARQKVVTGIVTDAGRRHALQVVDIARILCPANTCLTELDGNFLYIDSSHLSTRGAEYLTRIFTGVL